MSATPPLPEPNLEESRDAANAWVARFAPLVLQEDVLTVPKIRDRLRAIEVLRQHEDPADGLLRGSVLSEDAELVRTVERARGQLDSLETDLRRRLAKMAPGDPDGIADLEQVNERLDERLARQEIGADTAVPEVLELPTRPSNLGGAVGIGIFGLGWTAFTTFHAVLMIGGMFRAFGFGALALLLFYAIFWAVGFAMLSAAFNVASDESIRLQGRTLTITRTFAGWKRVRVVEVGKDAIAEKGMESSAHLRGRNQGPQEAVVIPDAAGRPVAFAAGALPRQREDLIERINAYLQAHG